MLGAVDVDALCSLIAVSLVAGIGLTLAFSLSLYGATRAVDLRRGRHTALAALFAGLAVVAMGAVLAGVAVGLSILTS